MPVTLKSDRLLFMAVLVLLLASIAWVYSASVVKEEEALLFKQVIWVVLGLVGLGIATLVDYQLLQRRWLAWGLAGVTTLALVAVFFCPRVAGTHRWLGFGRLGVQPSEFAKLVVVFFVAWALGQRLEEGEDLEPGVAKIAIVLIVFAALIAKEPDLGGTAAMVGVAALMMFIAGVSYKWFLAGLVACAVGLVGLVMIEPYILERLKVFFGPPNELAGGYQPRQALIAVATGGIWGQGWMQGAQAKLYLPEAHNDYIFAVIAQERGLVGALVVLGCFGVILWRGVLIARRVPDAFGSLLAVGITALIGLQGLVNISVVLKLLPSKGIALPLVSAGGSSMLVSLLAMGILLNLSRRAFAPGG